MAEVRLHDGETIENALRRFKRQVLEEEIIQEIKRRSYYVKPGDKKRRMSISSINATGGSFHRIQRDWSFHAICDCAKKPCKVPVSRVKLALHEFVG